MRMQNRKYSIDMMKIWGKDIENAERLVKNLESNPLNNKDEYVVKLDPEDFLDLCAGKWHGS